MAWYFRVETQAVFEFVKEVSPLCPEVHGEVCPEATDAVSDVVVCAATCESLLISEMDCKNTWSRGTILGRYP